MAAAEPSAAVLDRAYKAGLQSTRRGQSPQSGQRSPKRKSKGTRSKLPAAVLQDDYLRQRGTYVSSAASKSGGGVARTALSHAETFDPHSPPVSYKRRLARKQVVPPHVLRQGEERHSDLQTKGRACSPPPPNRAASPLPGVGDPSDHGLQLHDTTAHARKHCTSPQGRRRPEAGFSGTGVVPVSPYSRENPPPTPRRVRRPTARKRWMLPEGEAPYGRDVQKEEPPAQNGRRHHRPPPSRDAAGKLGPHERHRKGDGAARPMSPRNVILCQFTGSEASPRSGRGISPQTHRRAPADSAMQNLGANRMGGWRSREERGTSHRAPVHRSAGVRAPHPGLDPAAVSYDLVHTSPLRDGASPRRQMRAGAHSPRSHHNPITGNGVVSGASPRAKRTVLPAGPVGSDAAPYGAPAVQAQRRARRGYNSASPQVKGNLSMSGMQPVTGHDHRRRGLSPVRQGGVSPPPFATGELPC